MVWRQFSPLILPLILPLIHQIMPKLSPILSLNFGPKNIWNIFGLTPFYTEEVEKTWQNCSCSLLKWSASRQDFSGSPLKCFNIISISHWVMILVIFFCRNLLEMNRKKYCLFNLPFYTIRGNFKNIELLINSTLVKIQVFS